MTKRTQVIIALVIVLVSLAILAAIFAYLYPSFAQVADANRRATDTWATANAAMTDWAKP